MTSPVLAEVTRSGFVEGVHRGSVVAVDASGEPVLAGGEPDAPVLPRSALKPLQALGMLAAGLDVDDRGLALVCASHSGEPVQVDIVRRLLAGHGFGEDDLRCPTALPLSFPEAATVLRAGGSAERVLHNCSGKHAGMLLTCRAAGWPHTGPDCPEYVDPAHPLQLRLRDTIAELAGPVAATTVDGCGAPQFAVSLTGVARAFGRLASAPDGTAARRVADVMRAYPELVGGADRDVTRLMAAVPGLLAKDGAEGVYAVALADGRAAAVKIDDGAGRARMPVLVAALRALGVGDDPAADHAALDALAETPVYGGGRVVGAVRARELAS